VCLDASARARRAACLPGALLLNPTNGRIRDPATDMVRATFGGEVRSDRGGPRSSPGLGAARGGLTVDPVLALLPRRAGRLSAAGQGPPLRTLPIVVDVIVAVAEASGRLARRRPPRLPRHGLRSAVSVRRRAGGRPRRVARSDAVLWLRRSSRFPGSCVSCDRGATRCPSESSARQAGRASPRRS